MGLNGNPTTPTTPTVASTSSKFVEVPLKSSTSSLEDQEEEEDAVIAVIIPEGRPCFHPLLCRFGDLMFTFFLVFPLVIGIWRGLWQLMDHYSELLDSGPWLSISSGYGITLALHLFQEPLKAHVVPGKMSFLSFYPLSRILMLLNIFGSINQWRGLWKLEDDLLGHDNDYTLTLCLVVGIGLNLVFRTFVNVLCAPLMCTVDDARVIHDTTIRFNTPPKNRCKYFLDCVFSAWILPTLSISCWRGLWGLLDNYVYPKEEWRSTLVSLVMGYSICIPLVAMQPWIYNLVKNVKGPYWKKVGVLDLIYFVAFVGDVLCWRGMWDLYNLCLVFDTPYLGEWVGLITSLILLTLLGCLSSVVMPGTYVDGVMDEGDDWQVPYFSCLKSENEEVPFPEPWVIRLLFTDQKMNLHKIKAINKKGNGNSAPPTRSLTKKEEITYEELEYDLNNNLVTATDNCNCTKSSDGFGGGHGENHT